jgi:hypothetical protein
MGALRPEVDKLHRLVDQLLADVAAITPLDLRFQRLIAETSMLRLFYALDNFFETVALKLITNTDYCDGSSPGRIVPPFRSLAAAEAAVTGRNARGRYLKWTQLSDLQQNMRGFLGPSEHFLVERQTVDPVVEDMRHIRNHIAHGSRSTARHFAPIVSRIYLNNPRGISAGKLLLSRRLAFVGAPGHGRQPIVEQYLLWSKAAPRLLTKG